MQKCISFLAFLLVSAVFAAPLKTVPKPLSGKALDALNGCTITVLGADNVPHIVRLIGIDAPPKWEPWGKKSQKRLDELVRRQIVRVSFDQKDEQGYPLGVVRLNREDLSLEMLKEGLAWRCTLVKVPPSYEKAEAAAKAAKRGFWSDPELEAPDEAARHPKPAGVDAVTRATPKSRKK